MANSPLDQLLDVACKVEPVENGDDPEPSTHWFQRRYQAIRVQGHRSQGEVAQFTGSATSALGRQLALKRGRSMHVVLQVSDYMGRINEERALLLSGHVRDVLDQVVRGTASSRRCELRSALAACSSLPDLASLILAKESSGALRNGAMQTVFYLDALLREAERLSCHQRLQLEGVTLAIVATLIEQRAGGARSETRVRCLRQAALDLLESGDVRGTGAVARLVERWWRNTVLTHARVASRLEQGLLLSHPRLERLANVKGWKPYQSLYLEISRAELALWFAVQHGAAGAAVSPEPLRVAIGRCEVSLTEDPLRPRLVAQVHRARMLLQTIEALGDPERWSGLAETAKRARESFQSKVNEFEEYRGEAGEFGFCLLYAILWLRAQPSPADALGRSMLKQHLATRLEGLGMFVTAVVQQKGSYDEELVADLHRLRAEVSNYASVLDLACA